MRHIIKDTKCHVDADFREVSSTRGCQGRLHLCVYAVLSCIQLFETPWTVAHQAPLSMGFPRQEYWSGLPFPSPGDLPNPAIEPRSPALQTDSLLLSHQRFPTLGISVLENTDISYITKQTVDLLLTCVLRPVLTILSYLLYSNALASGPCRPAGGLPLPGCADS